MRGLLVKGMRCSPPDKAEANPVLREDGYVQPTDEANSPDGYGLRRAVHDIAGFRCRCQVNAELRTALHSAGVDQDLANAAFMVSAEHAAHPRTEQQAQQQYNAAVFKLRGRWGADYEARLALANEEGRRLFEVLPDAVKAGGDYKTFMLKSGLGNAAIVIERLAERAAARTQKTG